MSSAVALLLSVHGLTRESSHPIHPATVHFPIAFLSLAYGLDLAYAGATKLQLPFLQSYVGAMPELGRAAHYLQALGILTGLVSASTGIQQGIKLYNNGGLYEADGKTVRPKMKVTAAHAIFNDVVLLGSVYSWYIRRDNPGFMPSNVNIIISALLLPALLWAANLGGTLTYNFGAGINLSGIKGKNK